MQDCGLKSFRDVHADENNILSWTGLIVPVSLVVFCFWKFLLGLKLSGQEL
jgi:hypothetical protein